MSSENCLNVRSTSKSHLQHELLHLFQHNQFDRIALVRRERDHRLMSDGIADVGLVAINLLGVVSTLTASRTSVCRWLERTFGALSAHP